MTLDDIAKSIEEQHYAWARAHEPELEEISERPEIKQRMVHFIEESIRHPTATSGKPVDAVKVALKLTSMANFRFGLLVGLLLWKPERLAEPRPGTVSERCDTCETTGEVCMKCGKSRFDCTCQMGEYSPVECTNCGGAGYLTNN
jgi:hypothetical protein